MEVLMPHEDEYDVKIPQAEEELARLHKQRALLQLQNQLAEEQRLIDNSQYAPPINAPVVAEPANFLGRYQVVAYEPEPQPAQYYADDANKIAEATRYLSEGIAVKWALNRLSLSDKNTWSEFCVWLSSYIRNFVNPDAAERRWNTARQRRDEPVSRFARTLGGFEVNLPRLVSDRERCERLSEGVLQEASPSCVPLINLSLALALAVIVIGPGLSQRDEGVDDGEGLRERQEQYHCRQLVN
ncbi:uncharacterized protein BDV14DRAFT_201238 [Aspergillus stella-maris]|uniref:uncharacterized protein n=1 Tax=Aspergillus stella-maris TaxID=1810926 RepID=UPI003CCE45E8